MCQVENLITDLKTLAKDVGNLSMILQGSLAYGEYIQGFSDCDVFVLLYDKNKFDDILNGLKNLRKKHETCALSWILIDKGQFDEWKKREEIEVMIDSPHGIIGFVLDKLSWQIVKYKGRVLFGPDFRKNMPDKSLKSRDIYMWLERLERDLISHAKEFGLECLRFCIRRLKNVCEDVLAYKNIFVPTSKIPQVFKKYFSNFDSRIVEELLSYRINWQKILANPPDRSKIQSIFERTVNLMESLKNFFSRQ